MLTLVIPCIGLYMLKNRCNEGRSPTTTSDLSNSGSPVLCLTPGTYGIPPPEQKPDAKVCPQQLNDLCKLVRHRFFLVKIHYFINSFFLLHFIDRTYIQIFSSFSWIIFCSYGFGKNKSIE